MSFSFLLPFLVGEKEGNALCTITPIDQRCVCGVLVGQFTCWTTCHLVYPVKPPFAGGIWLHPFYVRSTDGPALGPKSVKRQLQDAQSLKYIAVFKIDWISWVLTMSWQCQVRDPYIGLLAHSR